MKIGVITFFNYCNFGASLQCYGLSETLKKLGHKAEYIDYTCEFIGNPFSLNSLKKRGPIGYGYTIAGYLFYLPRHGLFRKFRKLVPHTGPVNAKNIADYSDRYDRYIAGSDQIWSVKLTDFDATYFLDFVKDPAKKMSYSVSFGESDIPEDRQGEVASLIGDYRAISVREDYGGEIVKELTGREPAIVLDPTLLLTKEEWEKIAVKKQIKEPYILVYQLGFSGNLVHAVKELKKEKKMKVHYVPFPLGGAVGGRFHLHLGPREWLALFRDAEYILTDSFHGIVYAILFEKKFAVVTKGQHKNRRVVSLLTHLGLLDRIISDKQLPDMDKEIDYDYVKSVLQEDREKSVSWLRDNL